MLKTLCPRSHADYVLLPVIGPVLDEFTEWAHGLTGRPMGKAYQAWSAASYVAAYLRLHGERGIEVGEGGPDEIVQAGQSGLPNSVTDSSVDMDRHAAE